MLGKKRAFKMGKDCWYWLGVVIFGFIKRSQWWSNLDFDMKVSGVSRSFHLGDLIH